MSEATSFRQWPWSALLILGCLWLVVINQLRIEWTINSQYNFGWSVPLLCAYLLWQRWKSRPENFAPCAHSWPKWAIGALAFVFLCIRLIQEANPGWRLVSWAITLDAAAITLCVCCLAGGWPAVKHFGFPVLFFLVAVPWPGAVENRFIQGMTRADTGLAVEALSWFGLPALQRGNVIEIAAGLVGINEACSGIRSFQATLMIALFFGEVYRLSLLRRFILLLGGIFLAFLLNVARTALLVWIASQQGSAAIKNWHDPAGVTILLVCFTGLWLLGLRLRRKEEFTTRAPLPLWPSLLVQPIASGFFAGLAVWFLATEIFTRFWYWSHETRAGQVETWNLRWPEERPTFHDVEIPLNARAQLRFHEGRSAVWSEADGNQWQVFLFRWPKPDSLFDRVILHNALSHQPEICLPATGLSLKSDLGRKNFKAGGFNFPFRRLVFDARGRNLRVFHCIWEDDQETTKRSQKLDWNESDPWRAARTRLETAWAGRRYQGLRVLEIAMFGYDDEREADAALQAQLERLINPRSK